MTPSLKEYFQKQAADLMRRPYTNPEAMLRGLARAETQGQKDPWIYSRAAGGQPNTASGPFQLNDPTVMDTLNRFPKLFSEPTRNYALRLHAQNQQHLTNSATPFTLTNAADKSAYSNLAKIILQSKPGKTVGAKLTGWRGQTPGPGYVQRFTQGYNAVPKPVAPVAKPVK